MASGDETTQVEEPALADDVALALRTRSIMAQTEPDLRRALERHVAGDTLYRLTPAAARRWKCRYRLMLPLGYFDGQSAAEAYGRALIAAIDAEAPDSARQQES
jgi:hypothetical protein